MRILLDSHVVLWWLDDNQTLGPRCRELIKAAETAYFSAVTPWELGIKRALGKLKMPDGLVGELESQGFEPLSITAADAEHAPTLPPHHRDPFGRMLVAEAQLEGLTLVTADDALDRYEIDRFDATT